MSRLPTQLKFNLQKTSAKNIFLTLGTLLFILIILSSLFFMHNNGFTFASGESTITSDAGLLSDLTPKYLGLTGGKFIAPIIPPVTGSIPVSNREQLAAIDRTQQTAQTGPEHLKKYHLDGIYHLVDDINLSGEEWIPIGNVNYFTGIFDGQGYVIHNMVINGNQQYTGLFGRVDGAHIINVGIDSGCIDINFGGQFGAAYAGGICGFAVSFSGVTVSNCYNVGDVSVFSTSGSAWAGGICGNAPIGAIINNCYNVGDVSASFTYSSSASCYAGGICGVASGVAISNCYNAGGVSASSTSMDSSCYAGGICGYASIGAIISNCYNVGDVSASFTSGGAYVGGICGYASSISSVTTIGNCYNVGDVSASFTSGGAYVGGICGEVVSGVIGNCYNVGDVSASSSTPATFGYVGGICGSTRSGVISNCYNAGGIFAPVRYTPYVGGICGEVVSGVIGNCYNVGDVSASSSTPATFGYVGGICGYASSISSVTTISNCYNIGNISLTSSSPFAGGICGLAESITINNCYWRIESAQSVNGNSQEPKIGVCSDIDTTTGLTSVAMRSKSSYENWDFDTIWDISPFENDGYPVLALAFLRIDSLITDKTAYSFFEEIEIKITAKVTNDWFEKLCNNFENRVELRHSIVGKLDIIYAIYDQPTETLTLKVTNPLNEDATARIDTITLYIDGHDTGKLCPYMNKPLIWADSVSISSPLTNNIMYYTGGTKTFTATIDSPAVATFRDSDFIWYINGGSIDTITAKSFSINPKTDKYPLNTEITLTAYPMDYVYGRGSQTAYGQIIFTISNEAPHTLNIDGQSKNLEIFEGGKAVLLLDSPAHSALMEVGIRYNVKVWEYTGSQKLSDYTGTPIWTNVESCNDYVASISIDSSTLSLASTTDGISKYFVYAYFDDGTAIEGDTAVLTVKPCPLRIVFDNYNMYNTVDMKSVPISWTVTGSGNIQTTVKINGEELSSINSDGKSVNVQIDLSGSGLRDEYMVSVTVTNQYGGSYTSDAIFYVYNSNTLTNTFESSIIIDNTPKVAGKSSAELLNIRDDLTLVYSMHIDPNNSAWSATNDVLTYQIEDTTVADVYYLGARGLVKASSDLALSPFTPIRVIGNQNGQTTLTITHAKSGMSVKIPVSVVTLENKLYMMTTSPVIITEVSYTNDDGISKTVDATVFSSSDVAIYEQSGIVGEIKFRGVLGGEVYLGSIRASQLTTGEPDTISNTNSYPLNSVSMRRVTNQTFFTYLPDGRPYNGEVTIYGGLYKNGVFVEDSMRIVGQERNAEGCGGSFSIAMDSNDFGKISIGDNLKFAYELIFDDGYAPQLVFVDGFSNNNDNIKLGDAILRLQPWTGQGFTAVQYLYQDSEVDITNSNAYIGIDDETGGGVLVANIVAKNGMEFTSFKYVDEFGYAPPKQNIDYTYGNLLFLSDKYTYLSLELTVDEDLKLKTCETRHYTIYGRDNKGNIQNIDLPFDIVNGAGWVIPSEMLNFDINLSGVTTDTSFINTALSSTSGGNNIASDLLNQVLKKGIDLPLTKGVLPVNVQIKQKNDNPLVYEVKGVVSYDLLAKNGPKEVYWSKAGEGQGTYKVHTDPECPYLKKSLENGNYGYGSIKDATSKGILGGFCSGGIYPNSGCATNDYADEFEDLFEKSRDEYLKVRNGYSSNMVSTSAKVVGYLTAEIRYDVYNEQTVLTLTDLGITFKGKLDYTYSYNYRVPAGPVPVVVAVEFSTGVGLEIGVKVLTTNSAVSNNDWIVLEAKTNGYVRLRGAAGLDIWVAAANVGVFGQADLNADFILRVLTLEAAAQYKVDATVGVDLSYRAGPPIRIFGKNLYTSGRLVLWEIGKWSTGWKPIFGDPALFSRGASVTGARAFSTQFTLLNTLASELSNGVPVDQLPADDPVVVGDSSFAVAAWSSVNLSESQIDLLTENSDDPNGNQVDATEVMALLNFSEITVGVFKNGAWETPFITLTNNYLPDVCPKVAIVDGRAVVVWQQMSLSEDAEGLVIASTDLWYSLYDGAEWLPVQKANAFIAGVINDYSVAMDGSTVAVILSIGEENQEGEMSESIHTICIDGFGQVTQNRVTFGADLIISPQIARVGDGFVFSYYTVDGNGYGDIVFRMIGKDCVVSSDFSYSVATSASLYGISPSFDYNLITNENGEVVIVWSTFSPEQEQYAIYAVKLIESNGVTLLSAPIMLDGPQEKDATLTLSYSVVDAEGNVDVMYEQIKYTNYAEYLDYVNHPENYNEEVPYPGVFLPASGVFENEFLINIFTSTDEPVMVGGELPVHFYVTNTGIDAITKISVVWDNNALEPLVWDGLCVLPNTMFTDITSVAVKNTVNVAPYTISVTYDNKDVKTEKGVLVIANPDVSIGKITVLNSEQGKRTFAVNLYSLSNVALGESDYSVRLSFFKDMTHETPAKVSSDVLKGNIIKDSELLALIDSGGLSLPFTYEFTQDDLDEAGEIPSTGVRLYVTAEIIDAAGNVVIEKNYSANNANVLFESLWRYGQNSIVATATRFDCDSSTVDVALHNNGMHDISGGNGRIVALLLDEFDEVLEVKTLPINALLRKESLQHYTITFSQSGYDVSVSYEAINNGVNDSSLSSLSLSSIPFDFAKTPVAVDGVVKITLDNVYNVPLTSLKAIAKDPNAVITVNGVSYSDVAVVDIPLQKATDIRIGVTADKSTTVYELTVLTDADFSLVTFGGVVKFPSSTVPATVSLYDSDSKLVTSTATALDGSYVLSAPEGTGYTLNITKPGYLSYTIKNLGVVDGLTVGVVDLSVLGGDVNGDGVVDGTDLTLFLSAYGVGVASAEFPFVDLNGDGVVDATDLTIFLAGYNKSNVIIDYVKFRKI